MDKVLVLNMDGRPLHITDMRKGFLLVWKGKADIVLEAGTINGVFKKPSIIQLRRYINLPFKQVPLSRNNVFKRDGYACVYCGKRDRLTLDHVHPKSKGGRNTWENLVTACNKCNLTKGDKLLSELTMKLNHKPYRPNMVGIVLKSHKLAKQWGPYVRQFLR